MSTFLEITSACQTIQEWAAVRTTPEVDITETVRTDKDYSQFAMAIAIAAIAIVAKDNNIE